MTDLNKMFDQIVNKFVQRYRELSKPNITFSNAGRGELVLDGNERYQALRCYAERLGYINDASTQEIINSTLELCAQVADEYTAWPAREIAATIRAKKK